MYFALSFLVGFWSLAGQFVYNRIIFFYVANSDYAAASIISMHLLGFLLGSLAARRWRAPLLPVIGASLFLTGLAQLIVWGWGVPVFTLDHTLVMTLVFGFLLALTSGFLVVRLMEDSHGQRGATTIIIADSLGSVSGAMAGGFYLVPVLGIAVSFGIVAALQAGALLFMALKGLEKPKGRWAIAVGSLVVTLAMIGGTHLGLSGAERNITRVDGFPLPEVRSEATRVVFERRTPYGVLSVLDDPPSGRSLYIDNRFLCWVGYGEDLRAKSQWFLGNTVMNVVGEEKGKGKDVQMAIVGLGCGTTLTGILSYVDDNQIAVDVVDINSGIRGAQEQFDKLLPFGMDDARTRLFIEEGFVYFAKRAPEEGLYDAVVIDVAWMQNMNSTHIFSREMFENVKKWLNPGGVLAIWSEDRNPVSPITLTIFRTLEAVFKTVVVRSAEDGTLFFAADVKNRFLSALGEEEPRLQYWVEENAKNLPVNELDNLVLNRHRFTLLGDHVGQNMRERYGELAGP